MAEIPCLRMHIYTYIYIYYLVYLYRGPPGMIDVVMSQEILTMAGLLVAHAQLHVEGLTGHTAVWQEAECFKLTFPYSSVYPYMYTH